MFSLLLITARLFTATLFLFRAFTGLRAQLSKRWLTRGETALQNGHPDSAIEDLRSALAYSPASGPLRSNSPRRSPRRPHPGGTSYFNTLWGTEPGSGIINLHSPGWR